MKEIPLNERIIFALDVDSKTEAERWVGRLESHITFYKVGLQLFIAEWFPVIDMILNRGHKVMVDLKFYDVPETVKQAVKQIRGRGVTFATVHGNSSIMKAAAEQKGDLGILAVTVLTSLGEEDMQELGYSGSIEDLVVGRARQALSAGCDGVVCSGFEAGRVRTELGEKLRIVTPGIRPGGTACDDQKRVMTAGQAIADGSDYLVVGRPISRAEDPLHVVETLQKEIQKVL